MDSFLFEFRYSLILAAVIVILTFYFYKIYKYIIVMFIYIFLIFFAVWLAFENILQISPEFVISYFKYQLNNSFKNKNLYIDSNYFLTSNTLFGIEKFSDVSMP